MGAKSIDDFFFNCLNNYEGKMDKIFHSAKSLGELQFSHQEFKTEVVRSIPEEWRTTFGSKELPKTVKDAVSKKIDETFQQLKRHFQNEMASTASPSSQSTAERRKCQEDALSYYTEEMDRFFVQNLKPSKEELSRQHKRVSKEAIDKALKRGGDKEGAHIMTKLAFAIDSRYKEFVRKAEEANRPETNDIAIGIDLGTTNCCVMVVVNGKEGEPEVQVILNKEQGNTTTTPSYVAYHEDGSDTFGRVAKERFHRNAENTIYDVKRLIGRPWTDTNLQKDIETWPFRVVNENGNPKISTWDRTRYPHEISARLLAQFRAMAEEHLNLPRGTVRKAVVTVPAYFTELQRRATNDAAVAAGLDPLFILSEPTAAAIAYSFQRRMHGNKNALIYDLGGGTFDVAIAKVSETEVDILGVDGDTHLGGQDFDQLLVEYCIEEFKKTEDYDIMAGKNSSVKPVRDDALRALSRIKLQCEQAKERLASCASTSVYIEGLVGAKTMDVKITKEKLEELCRPLVQKTLDIVERALESAKSEGIKAKEDIDDVILVGGSTRLNLVQEMLEKYFNGKQLCMHINPDEAVAYGAAVQASMLAATDKKRDEENNKEKRVENKTEETLMEEEPLKGKQENVKEKPKIKVRDVLPMSLGLEERGQVFSPIIRKNSKIPCQHSEKYVTVVDNQTIIKVKVFQGEAKKTTENEFLGEFMLEGIPPNKAGAEKVEVTMKINSMGILQVEAKSVTVGNKNAITIVSDRLEMDMATVDELRRKFEQLTVPKRTV